MKVQYKDKTFTIGVYSHEICLWDEIGSTSLGTMSINDDTTFNDVHNYITQRMEDYNNDIIYCSDCGTKINKTDIAGRYFAGIYCSECWDREWREREARETYD